jgi:hypothetical protein
MPFYQVMVLAVIGRRLGMTIASDPELRKNPGQPIGCESD